MGLTGDFKSLSQVEKSIRDLSRAGSPSQTMINRAVSEEVRALLKEEFQESSGPLGKWEKTKRRKSALVSKKIGNSFKALLMPTGVFIFSEIEWLGAHNEGQTFAARAVGRMSQAMRFSKKGKLISKKRFENLQKKDKARTAKFAKAHTVGERVLPARPSVPAGSNQITGKWAERIQAGGIKGMQRWYDKSTKG